MLERVRSVARIHHILTFVRRQLPGRQAVLNLRYSFCSTLLIGSDAHLSIWPPFPRRSARSTTPLTSDNNPQSRPLLLVVHVCEAHYYHLAQTKNSPQSLVDCQTPPIEVSLLALLIAALFSTARSTPFSYFATRAFSLAQLGRNLFEAIERQC